MEREKTVESVAIEVRPQILPERSLEPVRARDPVELRTLHHYVSREQANRQDNESPIDRIHCHEVVVGTLDACDETRVQRVVSNDAAFDERVQESGRGKHMPDIRGAQKQEEHHDADDE